MEDVVTSDTEESRETLRRLLPACTRREVSTIRVIFRRIQNCLNASIRFADRTPPVGLSSQRAKPFITVQTVVNSRNV